MSRDLQLCSVILRSLLWLAAILSSEKWTRMERAENPKPRVGVAQRAFRDEYEVDLVFTY
jgi:hypothetical protein